MAALARETSQSVKSAKSACFWMVVDMDSSSLVMRLLRDWRSEGSAVMRDDSVW